MSNFHLQQAMANEKSNGLTIALYFIFSMLGFHRFYTTGATIFNVIYMFTWGYMGLGVLADLFLVWGMAKKANEAALLKAAMLDSMINNGHSSAPVITVVTGGGSNPTVETDSK